MKLTKLQRHTAYIIMLAEAESGTRITRHGFCRMAIELFDINVYPPPALQGLRMAFSDFLPELYSKKPEFLFGCYWYNIFEPDGGWDSRKQLLQQCINETA